MINNYWVLRKEFLNFFVFMLFISQILTHKIYKKSEHSNIDARPKAGNTLIFINNLNQKISLNLYFL